MKTSIAMAWLFLIGACAHHEPPKPIATTQQQGATPGPVVSYADRIRSAIRPHISFSTPVVGNPAAELKVNILPNGLVTGVEVVKSSGYPAWDSAVYAAVLKAERIPLDIEGKVPAVLYIAFRPHM